MTFNVARLILYSLITINCLFTIDCKADIDDLVVNATPITKNAQVCGNVCIGVITVGP